MINLGMNYQPMGYQQNNMNYQQYPMTSNYQMSPNIMTDQQRAMQDAQMIQQQEPQNLMSAAWDNSMDQYQRAYDDTASSWNSSDGLMQFARNMRNKGYRGSGAMPEQQLTPIESLGYRRYG